MFRYLRVAILGLITAESVPEQLRVKLEPLLGFFNRGSR